MLPSLLNRLVSRLYARGKRAYPGNFLKGMFQANVASSSMRDPHAFRPRLELLEDRLAPAVSFAGQVTFATAANPYGAVVADLNGDGKPDLVTANYGGGAGNTVSVLLNTTPAGATAPTFAAAQSFTVGTGPVFVAVGDVNGDGRPDLAVANYNAGGTTISVLLNTTLPGATAASFAAQQTFTVGAGPNNLAFADLNADGRPDLVVTKNNGAGASVSVLLNTTAAGATAASFAALQTFAVTGSAYSVAVGDLNGDGRPDVVVTNQGGTTVSVLLNTTAAGATAAAFAAQQTFTVPTNPQFVALADLNGDGRPDLVVTNKTTTLAVFMNTTTTGSTAASFAATQTFTISGTGNNVAVGDFSGDGRPDLAIGGGGAISVLENTTAIGATAASFAANQTFAATGNNFLIAGDFNFDGRTNMVAINSAGNVGVYLNNLPTYQAAVTGPVVVGDFTGYGVQQYNQSANTYVQLSKFDPTALADNADGWVVGNFSGYGVQLYRPGFNAFGSFAQITPVTATLLSMDAQGDIVGNFPGYGTQLFRASTGWVQITPFQSTGVALDAYGNVIATFAGYGIQQFSLATNTWKVITAFNPTTFAVNAFDQIVAVFAGYGVQKFTPFSGWQVLSPFAATSVAINSYGAVLGNFPGYGVQQNPGGGVNWVQTTPVSGQFLALDRNGHGYGDFPGYGVNVFTPGTSWVKITPTDPALLAVADWPFDLASPY